MSVLGGAGRVRRRISPEGFTLVEVWDVVDIKGVSSVRSGLGPDLGKSPQRINSGYCWVTSMR